MKMKRYSELCKLTTFEERFEYLKLCGSVGKDTFGFDRYLNQVFYQSAEWRRARDIVIIRDSGCDLGILDRPIFGNILIHHLNPITVKDIEERCKSIIDPEYLIAVSHQTHNAIHYGDENHLIKEPITRSPNDTCPWRK